MATRPLTDLTHDVGQALLRRDGADLTDAQLLGRFADQGEEAAFEALVRRHAPMVLGTCRRLLRNAQDAEDAVQVVFLVLARKAASIWPREAVGNWLYGVACKAALKARAAAARRRERQVADLPEPPAPQGPRDDLRPVIDRELSRLPAKYRAVVVLCDLEGRTRRDAARQLGWPEGTVCGRLARARAMLARRLTRSGVAVSAVALEAVLATDAATACVPAPALAAALKAASPRAAAAGAVPPHVLALAQGVRRALWLGKLKVAAAALAAVGFLGAGVGVAALARHQPPGAESQGPVAGGVPMTAARAGSPTDAPRDTRTDAQRLPGVWVPVRLVREGKQVSEDEVRNLRLVLTDKAFRSECAGSLFREATYTIDPTREPRWMDLTSRGEFVPHVCHAIYRIDGDQLTLCYPGPGAQRPARFESKPGSGLTLALWRRVDR
jgi:RNA polymerase sigma factor (sigma-70 family)